MYYLLILYLMPILNTFKYLNIINLIRGQDYFIFHNSLISIIYNTILYFINKIFYLFIFILFDNLFIFICIPDFNLFYVSSFLVYFVCFLYFCPIYFQVPYLS